MEKELNFKLYYLIFAVIILAIIGVGVYAATTGSVSTLNPGHNSTQVFIPVGNSFITLQNAIDTGYLLKANTSSVPTTSLPTSSPYHFANQTLINITVGSTNYTMTLQEAINNNVFINGATVSYTRNISKGGEYAYNINVNTTSGIRNFYDAIKNNLLSLVVPTFCSGKPRGTDCGTGCNNFGGQGGSCGSGYTMACTGSIRDSRLGGIYLCVGYSMVGDAFNYGYATSNCGACPFGSDVNYQSSGTWHCNMVDSDGQQWQGRSPSGAWSTSPVVCGSTSCSSSCLSCGCQAFSGSSWEMKPI